MYGLAGARIGYAIANATTIDELNTLKSSPGLSISGNIILPVQSHH